MTESTHPHTTVDGHTYFVGSTTRERISVDQRRILAGIASLVVFLGAVAGLLFVIDGPGPSTDETAVAPTVEGESFIDSGTPDGGTDLTVPAGVNETTDPAPGPGEPVDPEGEIGQPDVVPGVSSGSNGGATDSGVVPVDVGSGDNAATSPPDPCAAVLANGETLLVLPLDVQLDPGSFSSNLTVTNCGTEAVDWTAATKPSVALAHEGGNLAPGSTSDLAFTVDSGAYDPGAFTFKIKVSEPGANTYVDVQGFRPTFGSDFQINPAFTTGGPTGCEKQCIVKALLTPNLVNANVHIDVKLTVPAHLKIWVSEDPIVTNGLGNPVFPGVAPMVATSDMVETWDGTLGPLSASTDYNIIVKAIDENGKAAFQSGTFATLAPLDSPTGLDGGFGAGGCANDCITKALVGPTGDLSVMTLDTKTTVPTRLAVFVSTEEPSTAALGHPYFPGTAPVIELNDLVEARSLQLTGLEAATTYHIIVEAKDEAGNLSAEVGSFQTNDHPTRSVRITMHKIHVLEDGDPSWKNRGEISFAWAVGDDQVGQLGERKLADGEWLDVPESISTYTLHDVAQGDFLPAIYVSGSERDADLNPEYCSMGTGAATTPGSSGACDTRWNVAQSGFVTLASLQNLEPCVAHHSDFQFSDLSCMKLTTVNQPGDQWAEFEVIVSLEILD